ncbi:MAG TPA: M15 family metallopeptidase [Candidatus Nanoarchaeia archaeon]
MNFKRGLIFYFFLVITILLAIVFSPRGIEQGKSKELGLVTTKLPLETQLERIKPLSIAATVSAQKATEISSRVIVTEKGDDLSVLINKHIRLPETYEPADLVTIDDKVVTTKSEMKLREEAANALREMAKAAKKDGVSLIVLSAYRSYWSQQATFSYWVSSAGLVAAETFSARPGHSQHQLGTTVDFTSESANLGLAEDFDASKEGKWLADNAYKYGFVLAYPKGKEHITGYMYEPWHYRYIGPENAQKMIESGFILEEFLRKFGVV